MTARRRGANAPDDSDIIGTRPRRTPEPIGPLFDEPAPPQPAAKDDPPHKG